jgi:predicted HAD superfamily hydrolase
MFKVGTNETTIIQLIESVECVSFDFFDTLARRRDIFFERDIFSLVEQRALLTLVSKADRYSSIREQAEHAARAQALNMGFSEVNLLEIYAVLAKRMQVSQAELDYLRNLEMQCEAEVLERDDFAFSLYSHAAFAGKRIFITTDSYFSEEFIREACGRLGYGKAELLVSSTHRKMKQDGALFEILIEKCGVPVSQILHIGNNSLSDVSVPLSKGLVAWLYLNQKGRFRRSIGAISSKSGSPSISRILCGIAENMEPKAQTGTIESAIEDRIGMCLAFLIMSFALWLGEQVRHRETCKVFFLARDGQILKRFFDIYAEHRGWRIDSRYLLVSRASLYPSLIFTDAEAALDRFSHAWDDLPIARAVERLSLNFDEFGQVLKKHGFNSPDTKLSTSNVGSFRTFMRENWKLIQERNQEKHGNISKYLDQEGFLSSEGAVVVDLGWHLSLQKCLVGLTRSLGIEKPIFGFYLGIFRSAPTAVDLVADGYLINRDKPADISNLVHCGPSLIELLHSADHGTVTGYRKRGNKIEPVLEQNEAEETQYSRVIAPIQSAALRYFTEWVSRLGVDNVPHLDPELSARIGLKMVHSPNREEASFLGQLKMATDFGGKLKSITGAGEWNLGQIMGDTLPDGTVPMWRPGFESLRSLPPRRRTTDDLRSDAI